MRRYCLALDLVDDERLIAEYEEWHRQVWPEVIKSIKDAGIEQMEIYRTGNRLFMIMQVNDSFTFTAKAAADATNAKVQEWEALMGRYQQTLPYTKPGEKWKLMKEVFKLS